MNQQKTTVVSPEAVGVLAQTIRTIQLVWRLLFDSRVSLLPKLLIPAALFYVVSPIDLIPDFVLGLGQLDDLGIVVLAIALFIELCPRKIVQEHRQAIARQATGTDAPKDENVIDGSYRQI